MNTGLGSLASAPKRRLPRAVRLGLGAVFGLVLFVAQGAACAATDNFTGNGDWSTSTNWDTGLTPGSGDDVGISIFGSTRSIVDSSFNVSKLTISATGLSMEIVSNMTLMVTNAVTIGGGVNSAMVQMDTGSILTADSITLAGNGYLTLKDGSATSAITINGGGLVLDGTVTIGSLSGTSGTVSGEATLDAGGDNTSTTYGGTIFDINASNVIALIKSGTGTLTLTGANTYHGGTTIQGGAISVSADANLGATSGGLTLNGGTLETTAGFTSSRAVTLNSGGGTFQVDTGTLELDGVVSGTGGLTKTGTGTLYLNASNTYTGPTTINGGILEAGVSALLDSSSVTVNNGATLQLASGVNASNPLTINGAGAGGIGALNNSGTSSNHYLGSITLGSASTITAASVGTGASLSLQGAVDNGGFLLTLDGVAAFGFVSGGLSGSGGLTMNGYSWQIDTVATSYTGATTVNAGTLVLGIADAIANSSSVTVAGGTFLTEADEKIHNLAESSGSIDLGGTLTVVETADTTVVDGITGSPGNLTLDAASTATLTLLGANTYDGTTTVNGGTLRAATLAGNAIVNSGGTLGTATASGTLNIAGDLAVNNGGTLSLRIADATHADKIVVGGALTLGATSVLSLSSANGLSVGNSFTLLTAAGGVTGTFGTVSNALNNAVKYTVSYDTASTPNALDLVVNATQTSFVPFAANGNETSVARTLDSAADDTRAKTLIDYLNALPGTSLGAAMERIAPTQQTAVSPMVVQSAQGHIETLNQRMGAIQAGSTGLALDQLSFRDQMIPLDALVADSGQGLPMGVKAFRPDAANRWGFFAAADGDVGEFTGGTGGQNSTFFGAGFDGGADYRLTPEIAVGFATGYSKEKQDFDDAGSNVSVDTVRFGPYATWKDHGGDWVDASVGGAHHWFDSTRAGLGGSASSSTDGLELDASAKYGHDFHIAKNWTLTPTLGLNYVHLDVDGYSESGSLAPLSVMDQTTQSLRSELGGNLAYATRLFGLSLTPWVQAGWQHEFLDTSGALNARLASGAGTAFSTTSPESGAEIATFGAGLGAALTERLTASLSYSGQANEAYQDHSFRASMRWDF